MESESCYSGSDGSFRFLHSLKNKKELSCLRLFITCYGFLKGRPQRKRRCASFAWMVIYMLWCHPLFIRHFLWCFRCVLNTVSVTWTRVGHASCQIRERAAIFLTRDKDGGIGVRYQVCDSLKWVCAACHVLWRSKHVTVRIASGLSLALATTTASIVRRRGCLTSETKKQHCHEGFVCLIVLKWAFHI